MSDQLRRVCPSCRHLLAMVDAFAYLDELIPFPGYAEDTREWVNALWVGHLGSHPGALPESTKSVDDSGETGVGRLVIEVHPRGLARSD